MTIDTTQRAREIIEMSPLTGTSFYEIIDNRDIALGLYSDVESITDYRMFDFDAGAIQLTRADGETFIFRLEYYVDDDNEVITCDGYTWSVYDAEEQHYNTGGDSIEDAEGLSGLLDEIISWAEK